MAQIKVQWTEVLAYEGVFEFDESFDTENTEHWDRLTTLVADASIDENCTAIVDRVVDQVVEIE